MDRNLFVRQGAAYAVGGFLDGPVREVLEPQAGLSLAGVGSSSEVRASAFSCLGISFQSAETRVTGLSSERNEGTYVTMIRTSIQGLNILDTVTAKAVHARMVITTRLPGNAVRGLGPGSEFSFWGTTFEDLRIAGAQFEVPDSFPILKRGKRPDHPYEEVLKRLEKAYSCSNGIRLVSSLMDQARNEEFAQSNKKVAEEARATIAAAEKAKKAAQDNPSAIERADANIRAARNKASEEIERNEILPIELDGFGKIYVAELQYNPYLSCLNMLRVEINCGAIQGQIQFGAVEGGGSCWPRESP